MPEMKRLKVIYTHQLKWRPFPYKGWHVDRSKISIIGFDWLIDMARIVDDTLIIHEES